MFWRGSKPTELLDSSRLVAHLDDLLFQHGSPLPTMTAEGSGSTVLADYISSSGEHSPDKQIFMATIDNSQDGEHRVNPNEML